MANSVPRISSEASTPPLPPIGRRGSPWVFQKISPPQILSGKRPEIVTDGRASALAVAVLFATIAIIASIAFAAGAGLATFHYYMGGISFVVGVPTLVLMVRAWLNRRHYDSEKSRYESEVNRHERDVRKELEEENENVDADFAMIQQDRSRPALAENEEEYYRRINEEVAGPGWRFTYNASTFYATKKLFYDGPRSEERQMEDERAFYELRETDEGRDFIAIDGIRIISEKSVLYQSEESRRRVNDELERLAEEWHVNPLRLKGLAIQTPISQLSGLILNRRYKQRILGGMAVRGASPLYHNYYKDSNGIPYHECLQLQQLLDPNHEETLGKTPYFIPVRIKTNLLSGEAEISWRVVHCDQIDQSNSLRTTPTLDPRFNLTLTNATRERRAGEQNVAALPKQTFVSKKTEISRKTSQTLSRLNRQVLTPTLSRTPTKFSRQLSRHLVHFLSLSKLSRRYKQVLDPKLKNSSHCDMYLFSKKPKQKTMEIDVESD